MFDAISGADSAVVAGGPTTIFDPALSQGCLPIVPEEVAVQARREMCPRQHLVAVAMTVRVPLERQALRREGIGPETKVKVLTPLLERATGMPDTLDHTTNTPVTTTGNPFGGARCGVVPFQIDPVCTSSRVTKEFNLATELGFGVLTEPLKWCVSLWDKPPNADCDRCPARVLLADPDAVLGKFSDRQRVGISGSELVRALPIGCGPDGTSLRRGGRSPRMP